MGAVLTSAQKHTAPRNTGDDIPKKVLNFPFSQTWGNLELRMPYFGFTFFCAWNFIAFFSSILTGGYEFFGNQGESLSVFSALANAFALLSIALLAKKITPISSKPKASILFALCGGMGTAAVLLGSLLGGNLCTALFILGALMTGVGSAWIIVSWGEIYSSLDAFHITVYILCSFGLAFLLYFLIIALPTAVAAFMSILLLPCGGFLAFISSQMTDVLPVEQPDSSRRFVRQVWRVTLALFIFGVTFWFSSLLSAPSDRILFDNNAKLAILGSALLVAILAAIVIPLRRQFSVSLIYRLVLPLTTLGFLLTFLLGSGENNLGNPFSMSAFTCLDIFFFIMLAETSHQTGILPAKAFGFGRFIEALCSPVAYLLLITVLPKNLVQKNTLLVLLVAICLLVIITTTVFSNASIFKNEPKNQMMTFPETTPSLFARQCEAVINRYKLSDREAEILLLVSRGRSVPHIAERLHIAPSTVKTHASHIYQKLGVVNRQEMLDVIERIDIDGRS